MVNTIKRHYTLSTDGLYLKNRNRTWNKLSVVWPRKSRNWYPSFASNWILSCCMEAQQLHYCVKVFYAYIYSTWARISTVKMCVKHANYSQNCATDKWRGRVEVVQGNTYLSLCTSHMFVNKTWLVQMACGLGGPSHGSVSINPAGYKCCLHKIWLCCICCLKNNNWTHKLKQHFLVWKVFACGLWSPDNQVSPPQLVAWSFMFQCMYLHN